MANSNGSLSRFQFAARYFYSLFAISEAAHEHPRIPGQGGAARVWRDGAARHCGLFRRGGGGGCPTPRRPCVGGQGANPRRRARQGGRRQAGQITRRGEKGSRTPARRNARHPPDRSARPAGAPPLHRGSHRDRARVLSFRAGRSGQQPHRLRGLHRRRHGHRGGGATPTRQNPHLLD